MPSARELLALEEAYESLDPARKRAVSRVQARVRGWAHRNKARAVERREARALGGCWARFALRPRTTMLEQYRAHLGGPIASGTGDLFITSEAICFYCDAADASERDGILFSPSKKKAREGTKPISLKISYPEIAGVSARESSWEPGVTLSMKDGSSMWFGGFYFPSSVQKLIENEWTKQTKTKLESARQIRTEMILAMENKRSALAKREQSKNDEELNALREEMREDKENLRRAEAKARDAAVEIEILRENEVRMEKQRKKLFGQIRDFEVECENLRHKTNSANVARRAAETKLRELETKFDDKIDQLLEDKNGTINDLSAEVSRYKEMWEQDKAQMRLDVEKARRSASELRDQRDSLVREKSKLTIELGELGSELTKFSELSSNESRRVCELESELERVRAESKESAEKRAALKSKYDEAMQRLSSIESRAASAVTEAELKVKTDEIERLNAHCEALRGRLNKKVDDLAVLRAKNEEAMEEISNLKAAREGDAERVAAAKPVEDTANIQKITAELEAKANEVKSLQAQVESLRLNFTTASAANAKLDAKYEEVKSALAAHAAKEANVKNATTDIEMQLRSALENKETKIEALQAELAALNNARETSATISATLKVKYEEAKRQIEVLQSEKENIAKVNANELSKSEVSLREQLQAASAKCEALQGEVDALRVQRENAAVTEAKLQSKLEETASNLSELKSQRDASLETFIKERQELERALVEAKEASTAALTAAQSERDSLREAKETSNISLVSLKAKLEESNKALCASKTELDLAKSAREEAMMKMHEAQRGEEAAKIKLVEVEKNLVQRETESKSLKSEIDAFTTAAKAAEAREREARDELQELRRQNDLLLKEHGTLSGRSKELEEKANQLTEVEKEMSALKAEITTTALQQEKWKQDVEYAKAEIERSRSKEEAHNEKYMDMLKHMSEAEREAASARAAESVARDYAAKSSESAKETAEREVRMRDELATMRVAYEVLSTDFRSKTEEFSREVSRLEREVSDAQNNVKVLEVKLDEAREKISNLEQLNIEASNKLDKRRETNLRQKEETKKLYEAYQAAMAQCEETQRLLEREQMETRDMHMQKALEKQRSSSALLGSRPAFTRQPFGDANRGGSPINNGPRALPGVRSIDEMLPSLAKREANAYKAIAPPPMGSPPQ
ncbi:IQ motif, EF-hand binding site [Ostreococcus tauri]|uniref:IQ motif, EF-hand binding site n=1 Tax=Ostreococcus tauri TaxID=70448 RepID=A0A090LZV6_OSTTA|nr:IQ motif, EF-hand binding site [Ostreococcus tauri]CEF97461.1 IQ motif, EF-hand binding site [Ostreococcus tauri]|eukprot:XP_003078633.2 IQ motif, EF-hand binding site [Ostreococcus tauri]